MSAMASPLDGESFAIGVRVERAYGVIGDEQSQRGAGHGGGLGVAAQLDDLFELIEIAVMGGLPSE